MANNTYRKRKRLGDIIEIPVHGEYFCYAQLLPHGEYLFFDYKSDIPLEDLFILKDCKTLFRVTVYDSVLRNGRWKIVGSIPVKEEYLAPHMEYMYDKFENSFALYNTATGEITKCSKEDARGLERCAVWDDVHVEDRLFAHYCNRPCIWLKEEYEIWK